MAFGTTFVAAFAARMMLGLLWVAPLAGRAPHGPAESVALGLAAAIGGLAVTADFLAPLCS